MSNSRLRSRLHVAGIVASLALIAAVGLLACGEGDEPAPSQVPPSANADVFPLHTEPGKRYLVDVSGRPYLVHADTAWSLIADISRADAELYLENRRQKGFNAILVNLLEHKFATNAPSNFYGQAPFIPIGD